MACTGLAQADDTGPALKAGHEYMIVTNYPNNLHVVDVATDTVFKSCAMPDKFGPGTAMMAPDKRPPYGLHKLFGHVYAFDLDTCKTTFHAHLYCVAR
mgnify:CR=1 FL=1